MKQHSDKVFITVVYKDRTFAQYITPKMWEDPSIMQQLPDALFKSIAKLVKETNEAKIQEETQTTG